MLTRSLSAKVAVAAYPGKKRPCWLKAVLESTSPFSLLDQMDEKRDESAFRELAFVGCLMKLWMYRVWLT